MRRELKHLIFYTGLIVMMASCQFGGDKTVENLAPNAHQVTAEEVIQTSSYTYVRVSADGREYWIAVSKMDVKEKGTYFWSVGAEMRNFPSKELKRTFPVIFFISDFTDRPITLEKQTPGGYTNQMPGEAMAGKQQAPEKTGISVEPVKGGITIASLYAKKDSYAGKTVKIRGEVIKFAAGIMDRNWIHIQDGTREGSGYDLTVTTRDSVKVGEVAVFEGVIALNKDFGAGYTYEVIMEDARLK